MNTEKRYKVLCVYDSFQSGNLSSYQFDKIYCSLQSKLINRLITYYQSCCRVFNHKIFIELIDENKQFAYITVTGSEYITSAEMPQDLLVAKLRA